MTNMGNSNHVQHTQTHTTNHTQAEAARGVRAAAEALGSAAAPVHSERSVRPAAARMLQRSGAAALRGLTV